jgi:outer membrane immunogenic protein
MRQHAQPCSPALCASRLVPAQFGLARDFAQEDGAGISGRKTEMKQLALCVLTVFSFSAHADNTGWSGCHAGLNAGYATGDNQWTTKFFGNTAYDDNGGSATSKGPVGGAQLGCDLQHENWVAGAQGILDFANSRGRHHYVGGTPNNHVTYETKRVAMLTGRLGYLFNPGTLVYIKAGWAWADNRYNDSSPDSAPPQTYRKSRVRNGWIAGAGVEYRFAPRMSFFAEYNHFEFGKEALHLDSALATGADDYRASIAQDASALLVGVNYHFQ